jgi:palmitoyltransferase
MYHASRVARQICQCLAPGGLVVIAEISSSKLMMPKDGDVQSMADFDIKNLAIPSVCLLISFLAYSSQVLFQYLEPQPLTRIELVKFNSLVFCIWICYFRACRTDPGHVPPAWTPQTSNVEKKQLEHHDVGTSRSRRCRRCEVMKPPRAHHCKICQRSVSRSLL